MIGLRLAAAILTLGLLPAGSLSYRAQIEHWRREREANLRADDGWLTVVGLFWLKDGESTVGASRGSTLVLPASAPARVGTLDFHGGTVAFRAAPGVAVTVNARRVAAASLNDDSAGSPDVLRIGTLSMYVIRRGKRVGIRLKDNHSEARRTFTGTRWFPVAEQYRVMAKFVPYQPPKKLAVPNVLGDIEEDTSPGYLEFTLRGQRPLRLDPVIEEDHLFIIFKDQTAGKQTYPSGRFLYSAMPKDGAVVLDFNQAVDPPCAFTPYATCPLPPFQNRLPVPIEAGELRYGH